MQVSFKMVVKLLHCILKLIYF